MNHSKMCDISTKHIMLYHPVTLWIPPLLTKLSTNKEGVSTTISTLKGKLREEKMRLKKFYSVTG